MRVPVKADLENPHLSSGGSMTTNPDDGNARDDDESLEGVEGCLASVGTVVIGFVFIALAIVSTRLLGFDVVRAVLGVGVILSIAVGWWRLRRKPQG